MHSPSKGVNNDVRTLLTSLTNIIYYNGKKGLHKSLVTYKVGPYPSFSSTKLHGVFLPHPPKKC